MLHISVKQIKSLTILLLILSFQTIFATDWPVQTQIDLSSGFGDFRVNRFHTGIDIRTGGRTGTSIFAPVSGYIQRIRTNYTGYGKGLYLKGDDGYIYVFGHLLDFEPKLDSFIKGVQRNTKRYFQDSTLQKDQFSVQKGDFLGFTGQTGAGAPHLHFEKRTSDNLALNPLTNGFIIDDKTKPVFTTIGFKMLDETSLFDNALRELEFTPIYDSVSQNYYLDTMIYFKKPFGLFAGVYDQMRGGGMEQSVYKLTLKIDKQEFYSSTLEKLDFETQRLVNLRYEYSHAVNKEKRIQRLYNTFDNDFEGSNSLNNSQGIIGFQNNIPYGHHKGEIIAEDSFGNKRSLLFDFIFGPEEYIYKLDSLVVENRTDHLFYFTPSINIESMVIDSVIPFINKGEVWGKVIGATIENLDNGQILCKLSGINTSTTTVRLIAFSKKALIRDNIFCGIVPRGKISVELSYEILEDGILVNLDVRALQSADARVELYYKEKLIGTLYPELFNMSMYRCFIPPLEKYEHIDQIGFAMSRDTAYQVKYRDSLNIHLVGHKDNQKIVEQGISFEFEKDNFYKPRFIEIQKRFYLKDSNERLVSPIVQLTPKSFICKSNFKLQFSLDKKDPFNDRTGLGWFDDDEKKWVWLDNNREKYDISAESSGGGSFAVLYDLVPPAINNMNIKDGKTYIDKNFKVIISVEDLLSGITNDKSFNVKIDKEWLIPEYDPETKIFIARPAQLLAPGKHHFGVEIIDQVGNKSEQYLNFIVKKSK